MNIIKQWRAKREEEKELRRRSENTMIYAKLGLINRPDVCIKGQTTCACVCNSCMKEQHENMDKLLKELGM